MSNNAAYVDPSPEPTSTSTATPNFSPPAKGDAVAVALTVGIVGICMFTLITWLVLRLRRRRPQDPPRPQRLSSVTTRFRPSFASDASSRFGFSESQPRIPRSLSPHTDISYASPSRTEIAAPCQSSAARWPRPRRRKLGFCGPRSRPKSVATRSHQAHPSALAVSQIALVSLQQGRVWSILARHSALVRPRASACCIHPRRSPSLDPIRVQRSTLITSLVLLLADDTDELQSELYSAA